jgi:hypothetical protein
LPLTDPLAGGLLASVPEGKWWDSWWIVLCDGTPIPGKHGGGIALLLQIRRTRMLGRLLAILHFSPFVDALDRRFAVWRRWLSRFVPEGPAPRRYP